MLEQFVEFIKAQPADRVINHARGWAGCAVGDFGREVVADTVPAYTPAYFETVVARLFVEDGSNNSGRMQVYGCEYRETRGLMDMLDLIPSATTYGGLQKQLEAMAY
jgi:hypothetical protein